MDRPVHLSVHGASGVGKTALGRWLHENAGVLWFEADQSPRDGLEIAGLKELWERFLAGDGAGLVAELDRRVLAKGRRYGVITLPSTCFVAVECERFVAVELWDAPERCRERFCARVAELEREEAERHWEAHNVEARARAPGPRRVVVADGGRLRGLAEIAADVERLRAR